MFISAIPDPLATTLGGDQSSVGQDLHVVRDGGLRKPDFGLDVACAESRGFTNGAVALLPEHPQDAAASRIGNGAQLVGEMTISVLIHGHQYRFARRVERMKKSAPQRAFPKREAVTS